MLTKADYFPIAARPDVFNYFFQALFINYVIKSHFYSFIVKLNGTILNQGPVIVSLSAFTSVAFVSLLQLRRPKNAACHAVLISSMTFLRIRSFE